MDFSQLENIGTRECREFAEKIFNRHRLIDRFLKTRYIKTARARGYKVANIELSELDKRLMFSSGSAACSDDSICDLAEVRARQCEEVCNDLAHGRERHYGCVERLRLNLISFFEYAGIDYPCTLTENDTQDKRAEKILKTANRLKCAKWWRRRLRTVLGRQVEHVLRSIGFTRSGKSPYVSNWALARFMASQERNKKTIARLEAVTRNDDGTELAVALKDCIEKSISNPVNRRNELMVRMRGYEEIAEGLKLTGLFFTLTTPSRFHAQYERGGQNAKYDGSTPLEALEHLNKMWSLIRAEWAREGIKAFGFRVSEPHHDGTPHFHFLLFFNPVDVTNAKKIFGDYALSVDGDEKGAMEKRWDCKEIKREFGSATGYIAKYVAKNIDGFAVGTDEEGQCLADEGALRARAWASIWGIRQFQPIGSVSVTVWRELRRQREIFSDAVPEVVEALRDAADRGEWCEFVNLMGGAFVRRDEQTLRPAYVENASLSSAYGDVVKRLVGVMLRPVYTRLIDCLQITPVIATREKVWAIRERDISRELREAKPPDLDLCQ